MTSIGKARLEAFSDGVIAIIITIMVLELKPPHLETLADLKPLWPIFLSYVLSFLYLGIYWNNHHHMLHAARHINGVVMWANLHLLFWLSLIPFTTAWMGENHFGSAPMALYGFILFMAAAAYWILQLSIITEHGHDSLLKRAVGLDLKGKLSPFLYMGGIAAAFFSPILSGVIYFLIALLWIVPDRRIEKAMRTME